MEMVSGEYIVDVLREWIWLGISLVLRLDFFIKD